MGVRFDPKKHRFRWKRIQSSDRCAHEFKVLNFCRNMQYILDLFRSQWPPTRRDMKNCIARSGLTTHQVRSSPVGDELVRRGVIA